MAHMTLMRVGLFGIEVVIAHAIITTKLDFEDNMIIIAIVVLKYYTIEQNIIQHVCHN